MRLLSIFVLLVSLITTSLSSIVKAEDCESILAQIKSDVSKVDQKTIEGLNKWRFSADYDPVAKSNIKKILAEDSFLGTLNEKQREEIGESVADALKYGWPIHRIVARYFEAQNGIEEFYYLKNDPLILRLKLYANFESLFNGDPELRSLKDKSDLFYFCESRIFSDPLFVNDPASYVARWKKNLNLGQPTEALENDAYIVLENVHASPALEKYIQMIKEAKLKPKAEASLLSNDWKI